MAELFEIPIREQIACVERELAMRRTVYPRRVASGHMTQTLADRETGRMEAVLRSLVDLEKIRTARSRARSRVDPNDDQLDLVQYIESLMEREQSEGMFG